MVKVNIKSEKFTPFGGMYYASKAFFPYQEGNMAHNTIVSASQTSFNRKEIDL